ncbi:hypothetical protein [Streptomyces lacrimifluminis]|nr:hypothetical protein [Streptomyces lacrimifluminis]
MPSKKRLMVAGLTMALMAALGACGGGNGSGNGSGPDDDPRGDHTVSEDSGNGQYDEGGDDLATAPETATVTGLRDAVRHVPRKTTKATRPHMVRKCTSTKGSRKCKSVRSGTETYTRVVRQERWCVSLDDVDGDTSRDAVWYQVTRTTYTEAAAADRLGPMKFTPEATGCDR